MKTKVRVVSLRSFDPAISALSPKAFRAWQRSLDWSCFHATDGLLTSEDVKAVGASPATQKELLDAGIWQRDEDGRTFVAELRHGPFVAEVEGGEVEHRALTNAERQKAYRERKRNTEPLRRNVTERNESYVTEEAERNVTAVTGGPTGGSGSESAPDPDPSSVFASDSEDLVGSARDSEPRAKRRRAVLEPYPDGFPGEIQRAELQVYGSKKGLRGSQIDEQLEALELWARGKGERKADWMATAKGWLRRYAAGGDRCAAPPGYQQHQERAPAPYHAPAKPPEPPVPAAERLSAAEIAQLGKVAIGRAMP